MLWLILALSSGLCDAVTNVITRRLKELDTICLIYPRYLIAFLIAILLFFFIKIPQIKIDFYYSIFFASCLDVIAISLLIKAIKSAELAKTFPLVSFTPLFLVLTAFLVLGELPSLTGVIGIITIVSGAYLLKLEKEVKFFEPLTALVKEKGARWTLIAALLFSFVGPFLKKAVLNSSVPFTVVIYLILSTAILTPFFILSKGNKIEECRKNFILLAITGILLFLVLLTVNLAFQLTLTAYVVSIKRFSVPFTILLGYYFFKEKGIIKNLTAGMVMVIGAFLVAMG